MFSLKRTIEGLEKEEQHFRRLLECHLSALHDVREQALEVSVEAKTEFQARLKKLQQDLSRDSGRGSLEKSRGDFLEILKVFRAQSEETLVAKEGDLRAIIGSLGAAAEALGTRNQNDSARLKDFATRFQSVARETDLGKMRLELTRRVTELRSATEAMWRENQSSVSAMQSQLSAFQQRLERAEARATMDALTGVLNRGEGELRLRRELSTGKPVSIILIDLDGFKQVNDRWGHSAGDQVLKTFASTLRQTLRAGEWVSRWGGDEFLVTLHGEREAARERAAQLKSKLRIRHRVVVLGRIVEAEVCASTGVAQALPGESIADLLTRADLGLFAEKQPSGGDGSLRTIAEGPA